MKIKTKETVTLTNDEVKKFVQKLVEKKTGKKVISVVITVDDIQLELEERETDVAEQQA